jgi:hypothetical protein
MALETVHINPIAPDPTAHERYGSPHEHAPKEQDRQPDAEYHPRQDRLEISDDARSSFLVNGAPPDVEFARRAMDSIPPMSRDRLSQILSRIESGYYFLPVVIWHIADRLVHGLR